MTPQKRKADIASPAEDLDESPHKRARSEKMPNGIAHSFKELPDGHTEHSMPIVEPSSTSTTRAAARGTENEAAPSMDLAPTWDQTADKMLMDMKHNTKLSWARIEQQWERSTGEKPAQGMLRDRYKHLKNSIAESNGADGEKGEAENEGKRLETLDGNSAPPTIKARSTSPAIGGPSEQASGAIVEGSKTAAKPSEGENAAPAGEVDSEQDLPQSWEQANAGDRLIVMMKTSRKSWTRIEEDWQKLTGKRPAEGAVQNRYNCIKDLVVPPNTGREKKRVHPTVNVSTFDGPPDQTISHHANSMRRAPRRQKAKAELSEESLDESSDELSHESSHEFRKRSTTMARRNPRGAVEEPARASTIDRSSNGPNSKRTRRTTSAATESSDGSAEVTYSDESDEISKPSPAVANSAKRPRVKPAIAPDSGAQNAAGTPDGMLVEMRERGCTWREISKAWAARTGLAYVPETLRQRYARIKSGSAPKPPPTAPSSRKRKAEAEPLVEGSYEASPKRGKSTVGTPHVAETPVKRNMDRGKRKSSVKYVDSTTDEDELFAAPIEPAAKDPAQTRRGAGRTAKVDRSDPEWLVTNEKSPLAHEDLHAEFSNPKTYESFTKSDWEDLRETLPPNVPVNPDGYSIPMTFFKYDSDFRRGIREFQEDLGSGRLDPKWQADAAQAMEERAQGKFDAYKEDQFEAFWGQKQKSNHNDLAGESTKVKLDLLIQNEVFKLGDYFSYSRVIGRGKSGVLIEKDCKIVKLDSKALTLAIPPGQRKFSRHMFESVVSGDMKKEAKPAMAGGDGESLLNVDGRQDTVKLAADIETNGCEAPKASENCNGAVTIEDVPGNGNLLGASKAQDTEFAANDERAEVNPAEAKSSEGTELEANTKSLENEIHQSRASEVEKSIGTSAYTNGGQSSTPGLEYEGEEEEEEEDILHSISNLTQLESKIVDIDGRFNSKEIGVQNAWKNFRGIRNHQDLGSLFDMREEFYVYKHPRIVKEPKRKR